MTSEEQRAFREAAQVLLTLLRCISIKQSLSADSNERLNFFRLYDGCLMDVTVISWCKLFGSAKEQLHWSKLFPATAVTFQPAIGNQLVVAAGGDIESLSTLIQNYRDTYVAHHDLDVHKRASHHPMLRPLQLTGQVLYRFVYKALNMHGLAEGIPPPDRITGEGLQRIETEWKRIGDAARAATRGFSEP